MSIFLRRFIGFGFFFLSAFHALPQNPVYSLHAKPHQVKVVIMAIGTSIHQGSGNQEIYLAEVAVKDDAPHMAKLVDTYSSSGVPILRSVLTDRHPLRMLLTRSPECDTTGGAFFLNGDNANIFDAATRSALKDHATETIPCFTVAHDATRLAK